MQFKWEKIFDRDAEITLRAKVPNGWIIKNIIYNSEGDSQSMIFMEDMAHKWRIE